MKQGVWLLPTRRRIDKLKSFIEACAKTNMSTPVLILVQKDEFHEMQAAYMALPKPPYWVYYCTESEGLGDKVRELWPLVKDCDWCGLICDDLLPQTYLWDKMLLDNVNGKNVVSCDDGQLAPARMAGAVVWGGELLRTVGYMFPDNFWHTYVDNVWEELGRYTGCWDIRMDVLVSHDHGFNPDTAQDATHHASYSKRSEDEMAYAEWRLIGLLPALRRISEMQGFPLAIAAEKKPGLFDKIKSKLYKPHVKADHQGAPL